MFIDLAKEKPTAPLQAAVAIIGSGPAGITLARRLESLGRSVLIIESGSFDYSESAQELNSGEDATGRTNYLYSSRIRAFGGSSYVWGGWCRPLDSLAIAERSWIEDDGWPISEQEIAEYYPRAAQILETDSSDFDLEKWSGLRQQSPLAFKDDEFTTSYFQLSKPVRFGQKYRAELGASRNITVLLNATVTAVHVTENAQTCNGLTVVGPDNGTMRISAQQYVLACGGIENARLLLNSDDVLVDGIGNSNDQLGRYFQDHTTFNSGAITAVDPELDLGFYDYTSHPTYRGFGTLVPTATLRKKLRAVNFNIELQPSFIGLGNSRKELKRDYWELANNIKRKEIFDDFGHNLSTYFSMIGNAASFAWSSLFDSENKMSYVDLRHHLECSPNPESRVTVNKRVKDRLGQPVTQLDWQINVDDIDGWRRVMKALSIAVGKSDIGRLRIDFDDSKTMKDLDYTSAWHHIGTTRMHTDPKRGVVDENCRVHGVSNLYVAGSSVFPTSGHANPTFTIVALALRLGDHLGQEG